MMLGLGWIVDVEDSMTDRASGPALVLGLGDSGLAMARSLLSAPMRYAWPIRVAIRRGWRNGQPIAAAEFVSGTFH